MSLLFTLTTLLQRNSPHYYAPLHYSPHSTYCQHYYPPHYSCHCQRISDTDKHTRERAAAAGAATSARAARAAAAATDAEEAQAAAAQVEVVPAGTRRACFHAGMSYVRDKVHSA